MFINLPQILYDAVKNEGKHGQFMFCFFLIFHRTFVEPTHQNCLVEGIVTGTYIVHVCFYEKLRKFP